MIASAKVGNVGVLPAVRTRDDPTVDVEVELLECVGKPLGMSAWIMADRGGRRAEQGRVVLQHLVGAAVATRSRAGLATRCPSRWLPSVAAISIVRRFLRPAVTWET